MTDKGKLDQTIGKAKEAAGDITNNDKLKQEGFLKKTEGKIKEVSSEIKEKTEDVVEDVKEKFEKKHDKK